MAFFFAVLLIACTNFQPVVLARVGIDLDQASTEDRPKKDAGKVKDVRKGLNTERVEELKAQLQDLVGLAEVKKAMKTMLDLVAFGQQREELGLASFSGQSLHMRFLGNPGTGKTVVARIVGELLVEMGAIQPKDENGTFVFREASRADLVGQYKGQTAPKVHKLVQETLGGVLFIDEAYALVQAKSDTFGVEAVDALIKEMEDNRKHIIVILAGYQKEMEEFMTANPGFRSRVPFSFTFNDYTCSELQKIGQFQLKSKGLEVIEDKCDEEGGTCWWLHRSAQVFTKCCETDDCGNSENRANGNGRTVRNILESSYRQMALRVTKKVGEDEVNELGTLLQENQDAADPSCQTKNPMILDMADIRCDFTVLHAHDLIATTTELLNLNLAPCREIISEARVKAFAGSSKWSVLAGHVDRIGSARKIGEEALESECDSVKNILGTGALIEVEEGIVHAHETLSPLKKFKKLKGSGFCKGEDKKKIKYEKPLFGVSISVCANKCLAINSCTSFSFNQNSQSCYHNLNTNAASSAGAPQGTNCYRRGGFEVSKAGGSVRESRTGGRKPKPKPPRPRPGFKDSKAAEVKFEEDKNVKSSTPEVEKVMQKLDKMIGLFNVKSGMAELRALVQFDLFRKHVLPEAPSLMAQSYHMQFLGNPGTGKTVVARIVGELLVELGVIEGLYEKNFKGEEIRIPVFEEVSRANLVAEYVGQTAPKVSAAVNRSKGGVLFIDEAYSLKKGGKDSFGQEAVDTLIKEIEDKRDHVIAIFAGYEDEMETFFDSNPGFKSRVPFKFYFEDYTCNELSDISTMQLSQKGFSSTPEADFWISRTINFTTGCCDEPGECDSQRDNGNGRTVRNILEGAYRNFATRVVPTMNELQPVIDRVQYMTRMMIDKAPEYLQEDKTTARKRLKKEFGMEARCSKTEKAPTGQTWHELCELAKRKLEVVEAEDVQLMAATRMVETLMGPCHDDRIDVDLMEETATKAVQVMTTPQWEEVASGLENEDCKGTLESLKKVNNPPPVPKYDTLSMMKKAEELKPILDQLQKLIGLQGVKDTMAKLFGLVTLSKWRENLGMTTVGDQSFHMRFLGNPGTGKTVIARIVGELLVKMGIVEMPKEVKEDHVRDIKDYAKLAGEDVEEEDIEIPLIFKEASRADMVAQYSGQTAPKVEKLIRSALGGVLFVDEAYAIKRNSQDNFGQEAIDTMIKEMEDKRKNVVIIFAGYETEMDRFFDANPGFKSRVPLSFRFEDYSCNELAKIGDIVMDSSGLSKVNLGSSAPMENLIRFSSGCCDDVSADDCHPSRENGNGRTVRNIVEAISRAMATRVMRKQAAITKESLTQVDPSDLEAVALDVFPEKLKIPCGRNGFVDDLIDALSDDEGLREFFNQYQRADPVKMFQKVVRDTARMSSSLKVFKNPKLMELKEQCETKLDTLMAGLQQKATSICGDPKQNIPGKLVDYLRDKISSFHPNTLKQFQQKVLGFRKMVIEAIRVQRLLAGEKKLLPQRIQDIKHLSDTCEKSMKKQEGSSLQMPLEMAVGADVLLSDEDDVMPPDE